MHIPPRSSLAEAAVNRVRNCRPAPHELLDEAFIADFGYQAWGSRFLLLKDHGTLPGPDAAFTRRQIDSRPLFHKLLGLELAFEGEGKAAGVSYKTYSSLRYHRSHIEETFWHGGSRPLPPLEGRCLIFFVERDHLVVHYTLEATSEANVPLRARVVSRPLANGTVQCTANRFTVSLDYEVEFPDTVFATVTAQDPGFHFQNDEGTIASSWVEKCVTPGYPVTLVFRVLFGSGAPQADPRHYLEEDLTRLLAGGVQRVEKIYAAIPRPHPGFEKYESLGLTAAGTLYALECWDFPAPGREVLTMHAGKTGVAATWFWDSAFYLHGLALIQEKEAGQGVARLICEAIDEKGEPPVRVRDGRKVPGYQQPALAWGIHQFDTAIPDKAFLAEVYPALERYLRNWLNHTHNGLVVHPSGEACWDDALRWNVPGTVRPRPGDDWTRADWDWDHIDIRAFFNVDTNAHLFLELRSMARIARRIGKPQSVVAQWEATAGQLARQLNETLWDPGAEAFVDRHIPSGTFSDMITPASFLPIFAGMVDPARAEASCKRYLLDPERLGTLMPFPTLDRAHPAFRPGGGLLTHPAFPGSLIPDAYWIGRTWPHVSYWCVGALHQAGLEADAAEAAGRILAAMEKTSAIYECYDSLSGDGQGHPEFGWSAAAALLLLTGAYTLEPLWTPESLAQLRARK